MEAEVRRSPPYLEPLLAIVFDLDGTLVLSHHDFRRMRRAVVEIAERHGVPRSELSDELTTHEIQTRATASLSSAGAPDAVLDRFEAEWKAAVDAIELEALPGTKVRPGAPELLKDLSRRGFRLGVLTRSSEEFCRRALAQSGLTEFFGFLRTRSAPGPAKPDPEALLLLLRSMEVPTDRSLVVGDHRFDAECATRAGVRFYGILPEDGTEPDLEDRFRAAGAAAVARTLPELGEFLREARIPTD
jgi:HAD superfamily hydrolase (TIGR01549 family)